MSLIALILLVALLIPIMGIVVDSPIGRALARRLEGPQETPPGVAELAKVPEERGLPLKHTQAFFNRQHDESRPDRTPARHPLSFPRHRGRQEL